MNDSAQTAPAPAIEVVDVLVTETLPDGTKRRRRCRWQWQQHAAQEEQQ